MPVSKLGLRRQVAIPKAICEDLELEVGDFVEVQRIKGAIVIKPKKLVDREFVLTSEEEKAIRQGKAQLRRGDMAWRVRIAKGAARQLEKPPRNHRVSLSRECAPLKGKKWQGWYRKRVGRYRIIFFDVAARHITVFA